MSKSKQGKKSKEGSGGLDVAEKTQDEWLARVMEIVGNIGKKQVGNKVRCKIFDGKDSGNLFNIVLPRIYSNTSDQYLSA